MRVESQRLTEILANSILPQWEEFGLTRFAVNEKTLDEFNAQPLPEAMSAFPQKRRGKKVDVRGLRASHRIAVWPEDNQESIRYPVLGYVLKGDATLQTVDYVVHCPEGHWMLFRENVPKVAQGPHFSGSDFSDKYCEILWLAVQPWARDHIHFHLCVSDGDKHYLRWNASYHPVGNPEIITLLSMFLSNVIERSVLSRKLAEVTMHTFLLSVIQDLEKDSSPSLLEYAASKWHLPLNFADPIEAAEQYIAYNLHTNLTIQHVAGAVYTSRSSLIRRFQQKTGQTFNQYLTTQRLEKAKRLLLNGSHPIHNISRSVGISPAHLRLLFHRNYGMSPSEWADAQKKERSKR